MISDRRDNHFIEVGSGGRLWAPLKDPMTHSIHAECIRLQHGRYSGTKMIEIINNFLSLPWPFKPTLVCCLQFLLFLLFPSSIAGFLHFSGGGKCQVH